MISKELKITLEMIDSIEDPEEKFKWLTIVKNDLLKEETRVEAPPLEKFVGYDFNKILKNAKEKERKVTINDLSREIKQLKSEIKILKLEFKDFKQNIPSSSEEKEREDQLNEEFIAQVKTKQQKWRVKIALKIGKAFHKDFSALIDSGADLNCIREGLIPTTYYEKTTQKLFTANNSGLKIKYKLPKAQICNKGRCFNNSFILTKDITEEIILGTSFLMQIYPFTVNEQGITSRGNLFEFINPIKNKEIKNIQESDEEFISLISNKNTQIRLLQKEIQYEKIEQKIKTYKKEVLKIEKEFLEEVCAEVPTAF